MTSADKEAFCLYLERPRLPTAELNYQPSATICLNGAAVQMLHSLQSSLNYLRGRVYIGLCVLDPQHHSCASLTSSNPTAHSKSPMERERFRLPLIP